MNKLLFTLFVFASLMILTPVYAHSQTNTDSTKAKIRLDDSLFWTAYNQCNIASMMQYITSDIEFYHDKGGILKGYDAFKSAFEKNLCGNKDYHLRREAIPGTVEIHLMTNRGTLYGAIISGEHLFYITETGKKERLDGRGKFMNFWILEEGHWKMSRVLSYDHGPAVRPNLKKN